MSNRSEETMEHEQLPPGRVMRFADLKPGMKVLGPNGVVEIAETHDIHVPETMYEIEGEGASEPIRVSGNHLWYVETANDKSMHSLRLRESKKAFADLSDDAYETLEETAYDTSHNIIETSLADMFELVDAFENKHKEAAVTRIAKSLGHITEVNTTFQDIAYDEVEEGAMIKMYDAVLFSQQILALTGKRKYRKQWTVKIGQVITTERLVEIYETVELPVVKML